MSEITMKSVGELVRKSGSQTTEHYLVPDYQRGYRWKAEEQVKALLEDIKGFMNTPKTYQGIYCLQPVVVTKQQNDEQDCWEVIDGQQRLTTLFLLLHALKSEECFTIEFQAREESTTFLQELVSNGGYSDAKPDYYFMSEAYKYIEQWMKDETVKSSGFKRRFENVLIDQVKVIWYEVDVTTEAEKIEIFNRLNIGKIPLDDAELIRALFLNNICANKQQKETREETLSKGIFATEWLEMEYYLRQPSVWGFLFPREEAAKVPANRILKLFELIAKKRNSEGRATFRYFELELQKEENSQGSATAVRNFWNETKHLFSFFRACYHDRKLYHRMGIALSLGIVSHKEIMENMSRDKGEFLDWIDKEIKTYYHRIKWDDLSYDESRSNVQKVLLLFNVLTLDRMADTQENRFPFDRYNGEKWSVEHIHAQNAEKVAELTNPKEWIELALDSLEGVDELPLPKNGRQNVRKFSEIKSKLEALKNQDEVRDRDKDEYKNELRTLASDLEVYLSDDSSEHELPNLALLSFGNNAALNNSFFPMKRKKLLELERNGSFIPICTRNVFLKSYSPPNSFPYLWGEKDKEAYLAAMTKVLKDYIDISNSEEA